MNDLISRQAAIDALNKMKIYRTLDSDRYVISDCLNKIVNLPSAQPERKTCKTCKHYPPEKKWPCQDCDMREPADRWAPQSERKKGKWTNYGDPIMVNCSNCGYLVMSYNANNFCPRCGADMRGE